jgi:MFS family permease
MLMSITPLGERSRGFSWGLTASWFALGAVAGGALLGGAAGALGSLAPGGSWRALALLAALAVALWFDAAPGGHRLPSSRRQVNEDWLARYRGWVYGGAFGVQLGVGVATVVRSAAIYVMVIGAALCGSIWAGALVGLAFGVTRAVSLLPARSASDPGALARLQAGLARLEAPATVTVVLAELLGGALTIAALA